MNKNKRTPTDIAVDYMSRLGVAFDTINDHDQAIEQCREAIAKERDRIQELESEVEQLKAGSGTNNLTILTPPEVLHTEYKRGFDEGYENGRLHDEECMEDVRRRISAETKLAQAVEVLKTFKVEKTNLRFDKNDPETYGKHIGFGCIDMDLLHKVLVEFKGGHE